jgi:hypothetical protein|tara:strand:+ start:10833 stop:11072 length:240 start_codon:yes stop_codon:yes gene_type:complete
MITKSRKKFKLKFLSRKNCLAIAINSGEQIYTPYFFWPQSDSWLQIKLQLDNKEWLNEKEKIFIMNEVSRNINRWQKKL